MVKDSLLKILWIERFQPMVVMDSAVIIRFTK